MTTSARFRREGPHDDLTLGQVLLVGLLLYTVFSAVFLIAWHPIATSCPDGARFGHPYSSQSVWFPANEDPPQGYVAVGEFHDAYRDCTLWIPEEDWRPR